MKWACVCLTNAISDHEKNTVWTWFFPEYSSKSPQKFWSSKLAMQKAESTCIFGPLFPRFFCFVGTEVPLGCGGLLVLQSITRFGGQQVVWRGELVGGEGCRGWLVGSFKNHRKTIMVRGNCRLWCSTIMTWIWLQCVEKVLKKNLPNGSFMAVLLLRLVFQQKVTMCISFCSMLSMFHAFPHQWLSQHRSSFQ